MDKKHMKIIEITEVLNKRLNCSQDFTGEYSTNCDVHFMLSEKFTFQVFDQVHIIDRIQMSTDWDDAVKLVYGNENRIFFCFPVSKTLVHKVLNRVKFEQKEGILKGWSFHEDILEMLTGVRETSSVY